MKRVLKIMGIVLLVLSLFSTSIMADEVDYGQRLNEVVDLIMQDYLYNDSVTRDQLYEAAMNGVFGELDKFSGYIAPSSADSFSTSLNGGSYVGIGVQMIQLSNYIVIDRVFFDGPAEKAGLKVHDRIVGVDGESLVGKTTTEAASKIMGDKGTSVTLTIDRVGYVFDVELLRDEITINTIDRLDISTVYPQMSDASAGKIGYLKIGGFTSGVDEELEKALAEFKEEGKKYLLLDLRDNGGGYVDSGINVLNQLVEAGPVLRFINNAGREIVYYSDLDEADFEIFALINENSASATEFVAAAIQENGGTLVGETSYGKGVAQYLYTMSDNAVVKLTQEAFYSGKGVAIQGIGVKPDVLVEIPNYLTKEVKYHLGDQYESVLNLESVLSFLGYETGIIDTLYDESSVVGLKQFQADQGLFAYGVCDYTTQDALNRALIESVNENDVQLKAVTKLILEQINKDYK